MDPLPLLPDDSGFDALPGDSHRASTWALLRALEQLEPGLNASPLPSAVASLAGRYVFANPEYCRLLGRDLVRLRELSVADVTHPEDVERDRRALRAVSADQLCEHHIRKRYLRPDGGAVEAFTHVGAVRDASGRPIGLLAHVVDAVDHPAEGRPLSEDVGFRLLFVNNPQPMWIFDLQTLRFLAVNDAACARYGYTREQFLALTILDIRPPEDRPVLRAHVASASPGVRGSSGWRHCCADGRMMEVEVTSHELVYEGHDAVLVTVQDVTDRNRLERELTQQALRDPVTGLPNRALFLDRLGQTLAASGAHPGVVGVLYIDLDGFRLVNESLGHESADRLLAELAGRLVERVPVGVSVGRIAGDELAVCAVSVPDLAAAGALAHQLLEIIAEPFRALDGGEISLTACAGVVIASEQERDPATLMRNAALAVEQAKRAGAGQVACLDDHAPRASRRHILTARHELRRAIETGQIEVHYQPVVSLSAQCIVGAEALVRWQHPQRGLLSPAEFVPLAEETGLILPLGRVVLEQACRDASFWPELGPEGKPFAVSVNASARQLHEEQLPPLVQRVLEETGLNPARLALEITETVLVDQDAELVGQLAAVRGLGVHLAIDDFGTGYSSLTQLDRIPFNVLKVDRSFVTGMTSNIRHQSIVASIIRLAHELDLHVIAEGVESEIEAAALTRLGARFAQGFHYHHPMPARLLTDLLQPTADVAKVASPHA